jgi:hypothetical protein
MNEWNGLKDGCLHFVRHEQVNSRFAARIKFGKSSQLLQIMAPTAPGLELDLQDLQCCRGWGMHTYTHMHVDSIGLVHPRHNSSLDIGRTVPAVGWTPRDGVQLCNYNITEKT